MGGGGRMPNIYHDRQRAGTRRALAPLFPNLTLTNPASIQVYVPASCGMHLSTSHSIRTCRAMNMQAIHALLRKWAASSHPAILRRRTLSRCEHITWLPITRAGRDTEYEEVP